LDERAGIGGKRLSERDVTVSNFVSRNFENRATNPRVGKNYPFKQRLGGFAVEGMCVHILQHPPEKGL
jgi:hypothetical protein